MVLGLFHLFRRLNLLSLSLKNRQMIIEKPGLTYTKVVKLFKYGKNNNRYYNRVKLV